MKKRYGNIKVEPSSVKSPVTGEAIYYHQEVGTKMSVLFVPMGNRIKGFIRGKISCTECDAVMSKQFITLADSPQMYRVFGSRSDLKSFMANGRPIRKVINSLDIFATNEWHLHGCDKIT